MSADLTAAQAIVDRIRKAPHSTITREDAEILLASPERTLMMDKLLAIHFNQANDFPRALEQAERVFAQERTAEGAKKIGRAHV